MGRVSFTTKSGKRVSFSTGKKSHKKRAGPKRKSSKRKTTRKPNKQAKRSTRSHMPRRKKSSGRRPGKKSFIDRIPILKNKTVQKIGFGLGMGVVVVEGIKLLSRFAPPAIAQPLQQNAGIIKIGVELATEPLAAVFDVVTNPQMLSNITGRMNGGGGSSVGQNMVGFA